MEFLTQPWPWFVSGPIIGLFVPALLLAGNKLFGVASNLRHLCAAVAPGRVNFFRYDWKAQGSWNLWFLLGILVGGFIGARWGHVPVLVPPELISWSALLTFKGFVAIVGGGFLVGFGTAYAGGCTSGHAIAGLADFQLPSLLAVAGFFAGGLIATHWILPLLL